MGSFRIFALSLAFPGSLAAQPGTLDPAFSPGLNLTGSVYAVAVQPDQKIVLGGDFTYSHAGVFSRGVARLNTDGSPDPTFVPGRGVEGGKVSSIAIQNDGRIFIGGDFVRVGGVDRQSLGRLHSNGQLDSSFIPPLEPQWITGKIPSTVSSLLLQKDQKLIVGFDGQTGGHLSLGRFSPDGRLDETFQNLLVPVQDVVIEVPVHVQALAALPNEQFYLYAVVSDRFQTNGGWGRRHRDGYADTSFSSSLPFATPPRVTCMAVQPDGKLLMAGYFPSSGAALMYRFNAGGSYDSAFSVNVDRAIHGLAIQSDGKILISGDFRTVNNTNRNRIARLNPNGSLDIRFDPGSGATNGRVLALALTKDCGVLAAGAFSEFDAVPRRAIARLQNDEAGLPQIARQPASQTNAVGQVVSFYVLTSCSEDLSYQWIFNDNPLPGETNGTLTIKEVTHAHAGPYQMVVSNSFGAVTSEMARLTIDPAPKMAGTVDIGFKAHPAPDRAVQAIASQADAKILIGGFFRQIGQGERHCIARLHSDGRLDLSFAASRFENDALLPTVNSIAAQGDGKVIVGGSFTAINASTRRHIARFNADGMLDETFHVGQGPTGTSTSVVQFVKLQPDGKVVIAGMFTSVNGSARANIARLNLDGSFDATFNASTCCSAPILSMDMDAQGRVLLAMQGRDVVRLHLDGREDVRFFSGPVEALAVQPDGKILTARFLAAQPRLSRFLPTGAFDWEISIPGLTSVRALAVDQFGDIYVAARYPIYPNPFTSVPSAYRTLFRVALSDHDDQQDRVDEPFVQRLIIDGIVNAMFVNENGTMVIGGAFNHVNGVVREYVARLNWGLRLSNHRYDRSGFSVDVDTERFKHYVLESADSISNTTWRSIGTNWGTGGRQTLRDASPPSNGAIYRVQEIY